MSTITAHNSPKTKILICPYCGETQSERETCRACGGIFESLSRQATHNEMGPWFIRDANRPFQPGCSYETLVKLIERGQITKTSIIRGPTTKQFWSVAKRVAGIAHLLGYCHHCDASVQPDDHGCHTCGVPFGAYLDRNHMGLPDIQPLPGQSVLESPATSAPHPARAPQPTHHTHSGGVISSFAPDHELRESSAPLPYERSVTTPTTHHLENEQSIQPSTQPNSSTQAFQRTLDRQRRTLRRFGILCGVLTVITICALLVAILSAR